MREGLVFRVRCAAFLTLDPREAGAVVPRFRQRSCLCCGRTAKGGSPVIESIATLNLHKIETVSFVFDDMNLNLGYDQNDPNNPATRQLIFDYFQKEIEVDVRVAAEDDMYSYSLHLCGGRSIGTMAYFRAGLGIYDCIAEVARWKFGGLDKVNSFLDFASGHGRVTRFLATVCPKGTIWASEILPDAVRFQRDVLGVNAIRSSTDPDDFNVDQKFDFIYVGSLFTHLPDRTFRRWLRKLYSLVNPEGLLAFSTHGLDHLKPDVTMPPEGLYFIPQTEVPSLNPQDYGASIVTDDYVKMAILEVTGKPDHQMNRKAIGFSQDLWIISPTTLPKEPLRYDQGCQGHVDRTVWQSPKTLWLSGWASCIHPRHETAYVEVLLNGVSAGKLKISFARPDIARHLHDSTKGNSGWQGIVRTHKEIDPWRDVISVNGVCDGGKSTSLRTVLASSMIQLPTEAQPVSSTGHRVPSNSSLTTRTKLHNALDYICDGDWSRLFFNLANHLRGK